MSAPQPTAGTDTDTDASPKWATRGAIAVTVVWLIVVGAVVFTKRDTAADMSMNEWGDFLAGVSAPLALFWLIVGYFQQGQELALNTKALEAQVRETATLAENSARQAAAAELHAKLMATDQQQQRYEEEREASPIIQRVKAKARQGGYEITLANRGGEIRDLRIAHKGAWRFKLATFTFLDTGSSTVLGLVQSAPPVWPVRFELHFTNRLNQQQSLTFELSEKLRLREVANDPETTPPP